MTKSKIKRGAQSTSRTKGDNGSQTIFSEQSGEPRTLSALAYELIRRDILECRILPSAIIDERALMKQHGLGRTPIREALLRLSGERLVIFRSGQVIQVAPIGLTDIRDLYELRLHSERLAARLAVERRTPELVHNLEHCFDAAPQLLAERKLDEVLALDFRFHALLYEGSKNNFLATMLSSLFGHSYRLWFMTNRGDPREMDAVVRSHEPIIKALCDGDADRLDAEIAAHIADAYDRVIGALRGTAIDNLGGLKPPLCLDEATEAKTNKKKK